MKKIYKVNDCNAEGMGKPWVKSRITMACPLLTLVMILMLGAWSVPAWGATACKYISDQGTTINTYQSSSGWHGIGAKYKFSAENSLGSLSSADNTCGVSAISCKVQLNSVFGGKSVEAIAQYKVGSGSWTNIGSKQTIDNGSEYTFSASNLSLAKNQKISFQVKVTSSTEYGQNRSMSTTLNVTMAKSMTASSTDAMSFGEVEYGKSGTAKTRTITYSNVETGKTMSIALSQKSSDFTVALDKTNLDCSETVTATINFTPQGRGLKKDTAIISSTNGVTSIRIPLSGTGKRPASSISMSNSSVNVSVPGINSSTLDLSTLMTRTGNGEVTYTIKSATGKNATTTTASIASDNKSFSATECGVYTLQATQAESEQYEGSTSNEFTVTVNKLTPTIVFDNTDNPEIIYSGDSIGEPAVRMYNGKVIDRKINYVSSDIAIYVGQTADLNNPYLKARDVTAPEGSSVNVTITASASADDYYNAPANTTHNYAVRAKRSPVFTMDTYVNENASKTLNIGDQAIITYNENTNGFLTVGTASEHAYVTFSHDKVNRTITVTAVKGTITGDGVQQIIVNQPGNDYLFPRNITYTFTVKKNVSTLSLAGLTTAMEVEDTIATPYTGLANTETAVAFSCSPEGSMKMEDGKLIALQAGTNTVTFSQPATEYWTGISRSKTITVSKKNPNMTTQLGTRHPWYSIIEHPFSSLNTEKALSITSSNETLAKYIAEEDKIYVYGTSGNVTFTVNQDANYKYNAVENYQKTFEIFQPNNRLQMDLTQGNLSDYNGGGAGGVSWNGGGVVVGSPTAGSKAFDWDDKYVIIKFVGIPETLSFDFERTVSIATEIDWYFGQSADGKNWSTLKENDGQIFGGVTSGSESFHLNPDTRYVKLCYSGNYGGRFKNVRITERKEIVPKAATTDFGLGYNGNDPTPRTIKVDWYNVKPCTVTITGTDADKFVLGEGSSTINSLLDNYGMAELSVSYKHETNSETIHTANLHIEDADGNYADVSLIGQTTPAPQNIIWRSDLTPMPLNVEFSSAAMVESNQPLTLSSDHPEIVRVDENNTLVGVAAGNARVTATAEGNTKWAETTSYIDIEVTTKNVQFITWNDNLSNRKREDGQTVNITLTATSSADLPIKYELDEDAQAFASVSGNVLSLTGWGKGQITAKQEGNDDYVAVQAVKSLVSRNPAAGCKPLVGEYSSEYTLHTIAEKEIELNGEAGTLEFDAKCSATALYGLWLDEYYDGYWHKIEQISRFDMGTDYTHYGPYPLNRATTKVKIAAETGATMTRTFKNVEVTLAKYLELEDNHINFSQVDKGSTKTQSFYINYSNLTGVLDVDLETASTQFEVLTETVGEDCGDAGQNKEIRIRFTGSTLGTEENAIIVHNNDQSLRIPVTATVVLPSQTITWEPELNILTTDDVTLSATATSELPVSFTSGNTNIVEVVYEAGVYSLDIKSYGDVEITAHQAGNENWSAATDKTLTFHISRVVPVILNDPTATGVVLPNTLEASTLEGGSVEGGIAGTFRWQDATISVSKGVATYTAVFDPENDDWYETVPVEVAVPILKTPQTITWNRADVSEEGCSDVVILDATASSGLPITYHSSDSTKAYAIDAVVSEVAVKKLYILKGGDVTITAVQPGDDTYAAAPSVSKTISLNRVVPTIEELPTATYMYVHHFLSNSTPMGGVVKAGENTVTGVFNWANGAELMDNPGTNQRTVVFHPYNSDFYQEVSATIDVEVHRFAPTVLHNFTTETNVYGTKLSEFTLNGSGKGYDYTDPAHYEIDGTFSWKDADYIPSVAEEYAIMVFHPNHTEWYDDVEIQVPIQLTKATLLGATATATMFYGQVLGDAEITNTTNGIVNGTVGVVAGTITWDSSLDLMAYYTEGTHSDLPIRFTPTDSNYEPTEIAGTAVLTVSAGYVFDGTENKTWNNGNNWRDHVAPENVNNEKVVILADVDIIGTVSVDAMTIKDGVAVTVKNGATLTIGSSDSYKRTTYGNLYVETGGKVVLNGGELKVKDFVLEAELGDNTTIHPATSGQVNGVEQLNVQGNAYFDLALDPSGQCSPGWYDFTVPFPVDAATGITRFRNATHEEYTIRNGVNYAIMDFSESRHVASAYGWKKFSSVMQPGHCYSITIDSYDNIYRFKKTATGSFNSESSVTLDYSDVESDLRGWNGLGNGTSKHVDLSVEGIDKVQIYNHSTNSYTAAEINEFTYVVGASYFVQAKVSNSVIEYTPGTKNNEYLRAPQRRVADNQNSEFKLMLTREGANVESDRLYVSASEEALDAYEIGRDLAKFGTPTEAKTAQVWANAYDKKLCDVEMPLINNNASCSLGLYTPQAGSYELRIEEMPQDATLYLTYNGTPVWNLTNAPYLFDLEKGTTEGYGLRLYAHEESQIATGVEEAASENGAVRKVLIDEKIYIITPQGAMYDITGKFVK